MVYKRRYNKKRNFRKKSYQKRSYQTYRSSKNQANAYFKLRQMGSATATSGLITIDTHPSDVTGFADWSSLQGLYDNFVVKAIKVTIRPINVGDESLDTGAHNRGNLVSIIDMDGNAAGTSVAEAVQYGSCKFHNSRSVCTRYLPIPRRYRPKLNDFATGLDSANMDSAIRFIGDNYSDSSQYWVLKTIYIQATGRR